MKIMFMGTPDFAVASLRALVRRQAGEITVITQPDKPKGRKMILTPPEVKVYAESVGSHCRCGSLRAMGFID